ncbi:MAG: response regulator [Acidobacteriota bacterium]
MQITTGAIAVPAPVDILYIDDDAPLRHAVCDIFREEGLSVDEAGDGSEALAIVENGHVPALVFVDLEMPVMNGHEFLARFKNNPVTAAIPVVVVSGLVRSCIVGGPDGVIIYVAKPFSAESLVEYARRFAHKRPD